MRIRCLVLAATLAVSLAEAAQADYRTPVAIWSPPAPVCVSRVARLLDGSILGSCSPASAADPTLFHRSVDGSTWTLVSAIPWFPVQILVALDSGAVLVDSGSALRRSDDGGRTWTAPSAHAVGTLVGASSGRLALLVDGASTSVRLSTDGGATWSTGATLTGRGYAGAFVGANSLLVCQGVTIAAPDPDPRRTVDCRTSRDGGLTFDPAVTVARTAPGATQSMTFALTADDAVGRAWVATAADALRLTVTIDAGTTWLPAATLRAGAIAGAPALRAGPGGDEVWTAGGLGAGVALYRAIDGVTFAPLASPPDASCDPFASPLLAPAGGAAFGVLFGDKGAWTTTDGGTMWSSVRTREPGELSDPVLLRVASGRLLAVWVSNSVGTLASTSDDDGASWSAPSSLPGPVVQRPRAVAGAVRRAGGFVVAREGNGAAGCGEVTVFTSPDGSAWSAGVVVATLLPPTSPPASETSAPGTPGIAEDGTGRLGLVYRDGLALKSARSLDGGTTWSSPATVFSATNGLVFHSPLRTAADGNLVFLSSRVLAGTRPSLEAWTSRDGGLTYTNGPALDAGNTLNALKLWAAGPRLRGVYFFNGGTMGIDRAIESLDRGATWSSATVRYSLAGAPDGTFYGFAGFPQRVEAEHPDATIDDLGGTFPMAGEPPGVEVRAGLPCWAYRTFPPATAGLYFTCFGASLHAFDRDDSIRMLSPRPPLGPLFPLAAWAPTGGGAPAPGFTDTPLATRPLVFYGLESSAVLRMRKSGPGVVRLDW